MLAELKAKFKALWSWQFMSERTTSSRTVLIRAMREQSPPKMSSGALRMMSWQPWLKGDALCKVSIERPAVSRFVSVFLLMQLCRRKFLAVLTGFLHHRRHEIPGILQGPEVREGRPHSHPWRNTAFLESFACKKITGYWKESKLPAIYGYSHLTLRTSLVQIFSDLLAERLQIV